MHIDHLPTRNPTINFRGVEFNQRMIDEVDVTNIRKEKDSLHNTFKCNRLLAIVFGVNSLMCGLVSVGDIMKGQFMEHRHLMPQNSKTGFSNNSKLTLLNFMITGTFGYIAFSSRRARQSLDVIEYIKTGDQNHVVYPQRTIAEAQESGLRIGPKLQ